LEGFSILKKQQQPAAFSLSSLVIDQSTNSEKTVNLIARFNLSKGMFRGKYCVFAV
jgi:hypothetical protein